ncbi:MAG: WYL domain-containing protein [Clostridiales bacterium]|nr:WYL domain-containing protein [Clostridiales bacterium]
MARDTMNKKKYVVFDMVKILKEHTDLQHPMKQKELVDRLHALGYTTDRSTVRRTMTDLVMDPESRVCSLSNAAHDEKDCDYETYYSGLYYSQEFSDAELRWLIDGILYSRNVPHGARKDLLEKLCGLGNAHFRKNLNLNKIRRLAADEPVNPELFENIDRIGRAIDANRKITLQYKYMGTDFALHARENPEHLLNPYAMVIRNGFYYLICNSDSHDTLSVYRIDRMTDVEIRKEAARPVRELQGYHEGWNLQEFMEHNANMAFGDPVRITFTCTERGVPIVVDAFGRAVEFRERKDGLVDCTVRVPAFDMKLFAMQHSGFIRVTAPRELAEEIRNDLKKALEAYES